MKRVWLIIPLYLYLFSVNPILPTQLNHHPGKGTVSIQVGANRTLPLNSNHPHVEPHLATHPTNPGHLLGSAIQVSEEGGWQCIIFATRNNGNDWKTLNVSEHFGYSFCADPWLAIDAQGTSFLGAIADKREEIGDRRGFFLHRSRDGGHHWKALGYVPFGEGNTYDRSTVIADADSPPPPRPTYAVAAQGYNLSEKNGHLLAITVSASRDGGATFDKPVRALPSSLGKNIGSPALLPDGTLVVSFHDFVALDGTQLKQRRLWVLRIRDNGNSVSPPLFVAEATPSLHPMLAADRGNGPHRGRLYLVWHDRERTPSGIYLVSSDDVGETWSTPIQVSDENAAGLPMQSPMIAVNRAGAVVVSWQDRRLDETGECQHLYVAASLDGGQTFSPDVQVSDAPSCPKGPGNTAVKVGRRSVAERWPSGGDYSGLAAGADGRFHALWSDARNGVYQLYTAVITVNPTD